MTSDYQLLRDAIESVPCINAHVHQGGHQAAGLGGEQTVLSLVQSALPESFTDIDVRNRMLEDTHRQGWDALVDVWPQIAGTGYARTVSAILKYLGAGAVPTAAAYDTVVAGLSATPEEARKAYAQAGLRASLTNVVGHPCFGGMESMKAFLAEKYPLGIADGFHPLLGILPLHDITCPEELAAIEQAAGSECGSLDAYVAACRKIVTRSVELGVVGLKDWRAYSRGLAFAEPDRSAAEAVFKTIRSGENSSGDDMALSDYVFDALLDAAADCGLTVAMHTGILAGGGGTGAVPKAHPALLKDLLTRRRDVRFDLYHLGFPWIDAFFDLLQRFPNTRANCVWCQFLDPAGMEQFLVRALGSLPANRIIGYGSDAGGLFRVLGTLSVAKDTIAGALSQSVARGHLSQATALEIARIWLYDAPRDAYGLKLSED